MSGDLETEGLFMESGQRAVVTELGTRMQGERGIGRVV